MRASIKAFIGGPFGSLVTALGTLTLFIAVVQFVAGSRLGWMWLFLGAIGFLVLSFWRFHQMRHELVQKVQPQIVNNYYGPVTNVVPLPTDPNAIVAAPPPPKDSRQTDEQA